jgi:hypothetical protein
MRAISTPPPSPQNWRNSNVKFSKVLCCFSQSSNQEWMGNIAEFKLHIVNVKKTSLKIDKGHVARNSKSLTMAPTNCNWQTHQKDFGTSKKCWFKVGKRKLAWQHYIRSLMPRNDEVWLLAWILVVEWQAKAYRMKFESKLTRANESRLSNLIENSQQLLFIDIDDFL